VSGITVNVFMVYLSKASKKIHYSLHITHYSLLITHYPLLITNYSLPITRNTNTLIRPDSTSAFSRRNANYFACFFWIATTRINYFYLIAHNSKETGEIFRISPGKSACGIRPLNFKVLMHDYCQLLYGRQRIFSSVSLTLIYMPSLSNTGYSPFLCCTAITPKCCLKLSINWQKYFKINAHYMRCACCGQRLYSIDKLTMHVNFAKATIYLVLTC
jgi:hypothetical protein